MTKKKKNIYIYIYIKEIFQRNSERHVVEWHCTHAEAFRFSTTPHLSGFCAAEEKEKGDNGHSFILTIFSLSWRRWLFFSYSLSLSHNLVLQLCWFSRFIFKYKTNCSLFSFQLMKRQRPSKATSRGVMNSLEWYTLSFYFLHTYMWTAKLNLCNLQDKLDNKKYEMGYVFFLKNL